MKNMVVLKNRNLRRFGSLGVIFWLMMVSIGTVEAFAPKQMPLELSKLRAADIKKLGTEVEPVTSPTAPGKVNPELVSPDQSMIVQLVQKETGIESIAFQIYVTRIKTREKIFIAEAVNCFGLGWSPDSSKIVFSEGTLVHLADSDGATRQMIYAGPGGPYPGACFDYVWSQDGRRLAFIQVENVHDRTLAHPQRITLFLGN